MQSIVDRAPTATVLLLVALGFLIGTIIAGLIRGVSTATDTPRPVISTPPAPSKDPTKVPIT
jgi:hypothetical protein